MPENRSEMPLESLASSSNIPIAGMPSRCNGEAVSLPERPILIRPMLAKIFNPSAFQPCYVQPKLNGIRALAQGTTLVSRDGHVWNPGILPHIEHALSSLPPDLVFDGELYCHGMSLQKINERVAVKRIEAHKDVLQISYNIFDVVGFECFSERYNRLIDVLAKCVHPIKIVPTFLAHTPTQADKAFQTFKKLGYEGSMHRILGHGYSMPHLCSNKENRSPHLLKRKTWEDLDGIIIDVIEGEGKHSGMVGAFLVRYENITFYVGSGLDDSERREHWLNPPIGATIKVQYEMLSDSGIPLKPVVILIY